MRILHIGDFHYKSKNKDFNQDSIINKLINHLKSKESIDFIFFSGDLVFSGTKLEDFDMAYDLVFSQFITVLKINPRNIIISPGNHDTDQSEYSEALSYFLSSRENMGKKKK